MVDRATIIRETIIAVVMSALGIGLVIGVHNLLIPDHAPQATQTNPTAANAPAAQGQSGNDAAPPQNGPDKSESPSSG